MRFCVVLMSFFSLLGVFITAFANDIKIPTPPRVEEFTSPNGNFVFVVRAKDDWSSFRSNGALYKQDDSGRKLLWEIELPNIFRPRFVAVSSDGNVVTFDDWTNTKSLLAVAIYDKKGDFIKSHSVDDLSVKLKKSIAELMKYASGGGWWMSTPPEIAQNSDYVRVAVGGTYILINFKNGDLSSLNHLP